MEKLRKIKLNEVELKAIVTVANILEKLNRNENYKTDINYELPTGLVLEDIVDALDLILSMAD